MLSRPVNFWTRIINSLAGRWGLASTLLPPLRLTRRLLHFSLNPDPSFLSHHRLHPSHHPHLLRLHHRHLLPHLPALLLPHLIQLTLIPQTSNLGFEITIIKHTPKGHSALLNIYLIYSHLWVWKILKLLHLVSGRTY